MRRDDVSIIRPKTGWFQLNFRELWQYRDLIWLLVKRDITTTYKQTILGPLWILIHPLLTAGIFTIVFGLIAGISTDGTPQFLFYLSGSILWSYFSTCISRNATTFLQNAQLFGKVYFPRLILPITTSLSGLVSFAVQFLLFLCFLLYYSWIGTVNITWEWVIITPILVLQTAVLGTGVGMIVSSLTTRYRDLTVLVRFGIQLWMYLSPVVYPISQVPAAYQALLLFNPIAPVIETMRFIFLGTGTLPLLYLLVSLMVSCLIGFTGLILFNRIEKTFIDTI